MRLQQRLTLRYIRTKFRLLSSISKRKAAEEAFILFCTPQSRNKKTLPEIFHKAEKLQFTFQDYQIRGYRWNAASDKKVLILHGFQSSAINFDHYINPLIKNGFQVLAFDAPAHGRSSGKTVNVLLYKQFISYIEQHYGPVKLFLAHSFGGLAISLYLEETPHDSSYKAVLIAPATETKTAVQTLFRILELNGEVQKEFNKVLEEKGNHGPEWFSVARAAQHIKAKVLWLQDKDDNITPISDVKPVIDKNYPNFTFRISEGLGHRKIYQDSRSVKAIIEFLASEE